jgi:protein Mpv17
MAWSAYNRLLQAHPLKTKAATSSFITALSDVGLQLYENKSQTSARLREQHSHSSVRRGSPLEISVQPLRINWSRTFTLAAVGLCYSGPINHAWFGTLERLIRIRHRAGAVATKLVCDQGLGVPMLISGYFVTRGLFEGQSLLSIQERMQQKLVDATLAAWQFWPAVNLISFSVVPLQYRVLFGNVSAIFWNARLSSISSQGTEDDNTQAVECPSKCEDKVNRTRIRLRMILNLDPVSLDEAVVQEDSIPLTHRGRALAHWWISTVDTFGNHGKLCVAENFARQWIYNSSQCRAMVM